MPSSITNRCDRDESNGVGGGSRSGKALKLSGMNIQRELNLPKDSPIIFRALRPPSDVGGCMETWKRWSSSLILTPITLSASPYPLIEIFRRWKSGREKKLKNAASSSSYSTV